jgi:hypothetical protein
VSEEAPADHTLTDTEDEVDTNGEAPPAPDPPSNTALLAMLQELQQQFDGFKAETEEKLANERIQLKNAQRAHSQQCTSDTAELRAL